MPTFTEAQELLIRAILEALLDSWEIKTGFRPKPSPEMIAWAETRSKDFFEYTSKPAAEKAGEILRRAKAEEWGERRLQEELVENGPFNRDRGLVWARTELSYSYGEGDVLAWESEGIRQVRITDGQGPDPDEPCRHINGKIVLLSEYKKHKLAHPNCERFATAVEPEDEVPDSMLAQFIDEWPEAA